MREAVITRGFWCENCALFEGTTLALIQPEGTHCQGCGCASGDHILVKIVMSEPGNE